MELYSTFKNTEVHFYKFDMEECTRRKTCRQQLFVWRDMWTATPNPENYQAVAIDECLADWLSYILPWRYYRLKATPSREPWEQERDW